MRQNETRLNALFQQYLNNSICPDDYQEFLSLLNTDTINDNLLSELKALWVQSAKSPLSLTNNNWNEKVNYLLQQLTRENISKAPVKKLSILYKFKWAAAIILPLLMFGAYHLSKKSSSTSANNKEIVAISSQNKGLMPGGNKAMLLLADGTSVPLDDSSNGHIINQGNTKVIKLSDGQLVYTSSGSPVTEVLYNTISTPRGGQYQLTLADGTKVWLNSASSLRFPVVFQGLNREVEVSGEAYFEVEKNAKHPFKVTVHVANKEPETVEVLGTHFNINAYEDESNLRTTLFEGSVQVHHSTGITRIKPGQQLQSGTGMATVINNADLEEVIAWREGVFHFEDADIKHVMRQISRWYDIEVEYKGNVSQHFEGSIPQNVNIMKVLNMLELTGEVKFKIVGRKVVVLPQ